MNGAELARHAFATFAKVGPADVTLVPLTGGLLNEVFRARSGSCSAVVKYAPPHVASVPTIALSQRRSAVEAACLSELGPGGSLQAATSARVRAPRLHAHDAARAVIVMEDLGPLPDLATVSVLDPELGAELARFLGAVHTLSTSLSDLLDAVDNPDVQRTRQRTQYARVGGWLALHGVRDAAELGTRTEALGRRLGARGPSLIMGDLWPPSLLVDGAALRVIDWELAHAGQPAQDLGHLLAHLWMHEHSARADRASGFAAFRARFVSTYRAAWEPSPTAITDACMHAGCEILARVAGPFAAGYLYTGRDVTETVDRAARALRGDVTLWSDAA